MLAACRWPRFPPTTGANARAANDVLTELAADVVFGLLLLGFGEDGCGCAHFDQSAFVEKCRLVAAACRLLHVVGDDHDRVLTP